MTAFELGPFLALGLVGGLVLVVLRVRRGVMPYDRVVYAAVLLGFWAAMTWFAMRRGLSVLDRYLLFGIVLLLPIATLPWVRWCRTPLAIRGVALLLGRRSSRHGSIDPPPATTWLTWSAPRDVEALTAWLREGPHSETLLFTETGWASSYFALYWPAAAARRLIVSPWTTDAELAAFLRREPRLLITMAADEALQRRIERTGGGTMIGAPPLATFGALEVPPLAPAPAAPRRAPARPFRDAGGAPPE